MTRRAIGGMALSTLALTVCGCGKSNLKAGTRAARLPGPGLALGTHGNVHTKRAPLDVAVPVTLPLTRARAESFAGAVELSRADIVGSSVNQRSRTPEEEEREASSCGGSDPHALGGGRSPELVRGPGLDRESISSSVEVLSSAASVRSDLKYAYSRTGITCYARVLRRTLTEDRHEDVRLAGITLSRLDVAAPTGQSSTGVRIVARLSLSGDRLSVPLYVDALAFGYGPAEIDLYATSFVQPEPLRIEQQLLTLMWERARRQRL